jgi:hypothetical protein
MLRAWTYSVFAVTQLVSGIDILSGLHNSFQELVKAHNALQNHISEFETVTSFKVSL